jgi:hypothetical protein
VGDNDYGPGATNSVCVLYQYSFYFRLLELRTGETPRSWKNSGLSVLCESATECTGTTSV